LIAFLDTHAFVALGMGKIESFGKESRRLLETADLFVSQIVLFELHVLAETRKVAVEPSRFFFETLETCDVRESADALAAVVREAASFSWTRDPFDRLIVATAMLHRAKLITKDALIRDRFADAVW